MKNAPACAMAEGALSATLANFVGTGCLAFIRHIYVSLCYNILTLLIYTLTGAFSCCVSGAFCAIS